MPRRYRRRRMGRRRRRRNRKVGPARSMGPLSNKQLVKYLYTEGFTLNPGLGGTPDVYQFSCNGLYDPNITGIGHQPRGFDQTVGVMYDHATVIGCRATLWVHNEDTSNSQMVAMLVRDGTTTLNSTEDIMEYRYVQVKQLASEGSGPNTAVFKTQVNPNKFLGVSKPLSNPQMKNSVSSNPAEQVYLQVYGFPTNLGTDTGSIRCIIRIEYFAVLTEPRQPSIS